MSSAQLQALASYTACDPSASFPHTQPAPLPGDLPEPNIKPGVPYADLTTPGTIVLLSQPTGQKCAVVGGIMAARMKVLGAMGIVTDGRVRDLDALGSLGLPVWSHATSTIGAGAEAKAWAHNVTITISGVQVTPGDTIMIDPSENGIVSIPQTRLDAVLELLPRLVAADEKVMEDVQKGVDPQLQTMGLSTLFSDVWDSFSHTAADAEAPPSGGTSTKSPASGTDEEGGEEAEVNKQDAKEDDGDDERGYKPGDKDGEEDEEETEVQDPKPRLEEECMSSKECSPAKHHYDECVERVTGQIENDGKAKEDCVEEFFHLLHCATSCAAPKLFRELK
ncbi:RraA-like protein [Glonium stellatum]|uniref:Cytochrome b-c1 complex subunit 6, mitochondrial n=1 Tax=Glonium stellatum TaxID=574774 RepID=A0A8E2F0Q6_9PEZI|nr:RraA-like protein [Glonium stellatum]